MQQILSWLVGSKVVFVVICLRPLRAAAGCKRQSQENGVEMFSQQDDARVVVWRVQRVLRGKPRER